MRLFLLLCLTFSTFSSYGAIALVQHPTPVGGGGTTAVLAYDSNNTANNCLVSMALIHQSAVTPTLTIASSAGDSWAIAKDLAISADQHLYIWKAVAVGGANTVTVTSGTSAGQITLMLSEWSGADASCTIDQTNSASWASGAQSSGNVTPTTDGQLVMGFVIATGACGSANLTALDFKSGSVFDMRSEYQIQTTATTVAVDFTGGSGSGGAVAATLKAASAGSTFIPTLTIIAP